MKESASSGKFAFTSDDKDVFTICFIPQSTSSYLVVPSPRLLPCHVCVLELTSRSCLIRQRGARRRHEGRYA